MDTPTAKVLVLGNYHFANPGRDVVKVQVADVLSPEKQAEILEVANALARFQPTKIAVEEDPSSEAELASLYTAYRAGTHPLGPNETQQLGFRLAARFNHPQVYPINHWGRDLPFYPALDYAKQHEPGFVQKFEQWTAEQGEEENRLQRTMTVRQILRHSNDPGSLAKDHGVYIAFAAIGAGDTYIGAELLSAWYDRNIRIFANLQCITEPDDRILVVYGAGHAAILRELVRAADTLEWVDPLEYL
ncbi:hypothetical protein BH24DEI1_BH24DEI1_09830 [soil metagenome]